MRPARLKAPYLSDALGRASLRLALLVAPNPSCADFSRTAAVPQAGQRKRLQRASMGTSAIPHAMNRPKSIRALWPHGQLPWTAHCGKYSEMLTGCGMRRR